MIDNGRIVFQGGVDKLIDAQQSDIVATPEHPADLQALAELCVAAGKPARVEQGEVHVQAAEDWAPELNRAAMATGITLRGLTVRRASLEEAFFAITEAERDGTEQDA
jgi:ABC-type multidrug transport system ATPase subunit